MSIDVEKNYESDNSDSVSEFDSNEDSSDSNTSTKNEAQGNSGWANSMARVLQQQKPKHKKSIVLSKAKKLQELQKKTSNKKEFDFEIDGEEIKEEKIDVKSTESLVDTKTQPKIIGSRRRAKERILSVRLKPSILEKDRERTFKKIATKGVVQLFNAVKMQQQQIEHKLNEVGKLDHRRDRALNSLDKRQFLDILMSGKRSKSELVDNPIKEEIKEENSKSWGIFRDDFLTNKKISNWDMDEDNEDNNENNSDSDDD